MMPIPSRRAIFLLALGLALSLRLLAQVPPAPPPTGDADAAFRKEFLSQTPDGHHVASTLNRMRIKRGWIEQPRSFVAHVFPLMYPEKLDLSRGMLSMEIDSRAFSRANLSLGFSAGGVGAGVSMPYQDVKTIFTRVPDGYDVNEDKLRDWLLSAAGNTATDHWAHRVQELQQVGLGLWAAPLPNGYTQEFSSAYASYSKDVSSVFGGSVDIWTFNMWKNSGELDNQILTVALDKLTTSEIKELLDGDMTRERFIRETELQASDYDKHAFEVATLTADELEKRRKAYLDRERRRAVEEHLLSPDERLRTREEDQVKKLTTDLLAADEGSLKARRIHDRIDAIRRQQEFRAHGRVIAQVQATTYGVTALVNLFDPKASRQINTAASASQKIYDGIKKIDIKGKVDWTSIGNIADGLGLMMSLFGGGGPDQQTQMLESILENQRRMIGRLDDIAQTTAATKQTVEYLVETSTRDLSLIKKDTRAILDRTAKIMQAVSENQNFMRDVVLSEVKVEMGVKTEDWWKHLTLPESGRHFNDVQACYDAWERGTGPGACSEIAEQKFDDLWTQAAHLASYATEPEVLSGPITVVVPKGKYEQITLVDFGEKFNTSAEMRVGFLPEIARWLNLARERLKLTKEHNQIDGTRFEKIGHPGLFTQFFIPEFYELSQLQEDYSRVIPNAQVLREHFTRIEGAAAESRRSLPLAHAVYKKAISRMLDEIGSFVKKYEFKSIVGTHPDAKGLYLYPERVAEAVGRISDVQLILTGENFNLWNQERFGEYSDSRLVTTISTTRTRRRGRNDDVDVEVEIPLHADVDGGKWVLAFTPEANAHLKGVQAMPKQETIVKEWQNVSDSFVDVDGRRYRARDYLPHFDRTVPLNAKLRRLLEQLVTAEKLVRNDRFIESWHDAVTDNARISSALIELARARYAFETLVKTGYGNCVDVDPEFGFLRSVAYAAPLTSAAGLAVLRPAPPPGSRAVRLLFLASDMKSRQLNYEVESEALIRFRVKMPVGVRTETHGLPSEEEVRTSGACNMGFGDLNAAREILERLPRRAPRSP